jgi:hypothetical protein
MPEPPGLDDRSIDPEDPVQRAGGAGVESRVRGEQHQIGTELPGPANQHPPLDAGRPGFRRERQDGGAIGSRRRHRDGPAPEIGSHQPLDRGTEGGRIDVEDGLGHRG